MCGLYGWQYNESAKGCPSMAKRGAIATVLADRMTSRGRDSCGYATAGEDAEGKKVFYHNAMGTFSNAVFFPDLIELGNVAAHTRYATVGAKTVANAHPYHIGGIVGMHNGGIWNWREVLEERRWQDEKYEVDSQVLIRHIADGLSLEKLHGYGTVVWYDTMDMGAVFLCKLRNGDLEIELLEDDGGVVWASTRDAISSALLPMRMYRQSKAFNPRQGVVYRVFDGKIAETERKLELDSDSWKHKPEKKSSSSTYAGFVGGEWYGKGMTDTEADPVDDAIEELNNAKLAAYYEGIKDEAWDDPEFNDLFLYPKRGWYTMDAAGVRSWEHDIRRWREGLGTPVSSAKRKRKKRKLHSVPKTTETFKLTPSKRVVISDTLNAEERKRLGAMLSSIENHAEHCSCTLCTETFKLACRA